MDTEADLFYRQLPKVVGKTFLDPLIKQRLSFNEINPVYVNKLIQVITLNETKYGVFFFQELHAHLNGSVSFETMETLIKRKPQLNIEHSMTAIRRGQRRSLDECVSNTSHKHTNILIITFKNKS